MNLLDYDKLFFSLNLKKILMKNIRTNSYLKNDKKGNYM